MELYPQDLGTRRHVELIRWRAAVDTQKGPMDLSAAPPRPRMGWLGRFWAHGSGLTPAQAQAALPAAGRATLIYPYLFPYLWGALYLAACMGPAQRGMLPMPEAGILGAGSMAGAAYLGVLLGRNKFRALHRTPLAAAEVEAFPAAAYDELERAYVALIIYAIRQSVPRDAEQQVRAALHDLGEAIDRLPAVPPVADEAGALRSEVESLEMQAQGEADPVVAESLLRRAQSLRRRADTVHRTARLGRRALAVRQEILAQITTLHAGLAAFDTGAGDVGDLKALADSVRLVAVEADSLAAAHEELDSFSPPLDAVPPEPVPLQAGNR